jgi:hypothetical protein
MADDYQHRWVFIRKGLSGIYKFFKVVVYEIPKFLLITAPWEIIKECKNGIVGLYRAIPPVNEWPGIISRAMIDLAKGIKQFFIVLAKAIKALPKAIYLTGKYLLEKTWKGLKAIPNLLTIAAQKTWSGLQILASFLRDVLLRYGFIKTC